MTPPTHTILQGDSAEVLRTLPAESVQLCMTSPPYWGLRDYKADGASLPGQWGREPTPEEHIARLVDWAREVRRVLRKDGVMVINYGESYTSGNGKARGNGQWFEGGRPRGSELAGLSPGLKPKDLLGMPWRLAQALQADGWWWRCWWPWVKLNGMPESTRDRPALSCEVMLMFTRSARYYWDQEAVRVGYAPASIARADGSQVTTGNPDVRPGFKRTLSRKQDGHENRTYAGFNDRWDAKEADGGNAHGRIRKTGDWHRESVALAVQQARAWIAHAEHWMEHGGALLDMDGLPLGQLHPTYASPGSHFATYPPELVRPIVRAATSERGACPGCGAPWVRVVERTGAQNHRESHHQPRNSGSKTDSTGWQPSRRATGGWRPSCDCDAGEPVPQVVLDPFCGTGTSNVVAAEEGRSSIGIDLYGGEYDFGGHTAMDRLRAASGEGPALDVVRAEAEGQLNLLGDAR